ncbi:hypothetical protein KR038_005958 [Drosophila bunnanda]|nr:hypothetical protein KR038_005958 [Drosophila bunnanda]
MNLALNRSFQRGGCQLLHLSKCSLLQWLNNIDTIIYGGDGVLWHHDKPIEGAAETFNILRAMGKNAYICTNNSVLSTQKTCLKAQKMGCLVAPNEILSSGQALARFMGEMKFEKKVYVVGGQGIIDELRLAGIKSLPLDSSDPNEVKDITLDPSVGAVVVGLDENFNSLKLTKASCYLMKPQVMFVATDRDMAIPLAPGRIVPGAGSMVAALEAATKRSPFTCGKPNSYMCLNLMRQGIIQPDRTLMIGDMMHTDIQFGYNCGFQTLLVGTGVSSYQDALAAQSSKEQIMHQQVPDMYVPELSNLLPFLSSRNK